VCTGGGFFLGTKRLERDAKDSPSSSNEIKVAGAITSLTPHVLLRDEQLSKVTVQFYGLILIYEPLQELPTDVTPGQRCEKTKICLILCSESVQLEYDYRSTHS